MVQNLGHAARIEFERKLKAIGCAEDSDIANEIKRTMLLEENALGIIMQNERKKAAFYSNEDGSEVYILDKEDATDEDYFVDDLSCIASAAANVAWFAYAGNGEDPSIDWIHAIVRSEMFKVLYKAKVEGKLRTKNNNILM